MPVNKRRPAIEEARELVALVGALRTDGDTLDAAAMAARLGTTEDHAAHLLDLLTQVGGDSYTNALPLAADDDSSVTLVSAFTNTVRGRSVRLTAEEAQALDAAFDEMGLDESDDLRRRITQAFYPASPEVDDVQTEQTTAEEEGLSARLALLSRAILGQQSLEFDYTHVEKETPGTHHHAAPQQHRHVGPLKLRHEHGHWYLDAYDLDKRGDRVFRVDHMTALKIGQGGWERPAEPTAQDEQFVRLTFTDAALLDLFEWPGIRILNKVDDPKAGTRIECEVPWYPSGQWLPRHIAACGAGVQVDNPELQRAAEAYAYTLLESGSGSVT